MINGVALGRTLRFHPDSFLHYMAPLSHEHALLRTQCGVSGAIGGARSGQGPVCFALVHIAFNVKCQRCRSISGSALVDFFFKTF